MQTKRIKKYCNCFIALTPVYMYTKGRCLHIKGAFNEMSFDLYPAGSIEIIVFIFRIVYFRGISVDVCKTKPRLK